MKDQEQIILLLRRIAQALERQSPPPAAPPDFSQARAFVWQPHPVAGSGDGLFSPVEKIRHIPLSLLYGIENQKQQLLENSRQFALGLPANNALLWGARGTGKSSLVKAVHQAILAEGKTLWLIEIKRGDLASLPALLRHLHGTSGRFILFCDDLSFEYDDQAYKALKATLEGGLAGQPRNVLFYATSNRRHLMPREMVENERSTALHPAESVEEKVSLSDRFGLWIGFHPMTKADYLQMVRAYCHHFQLQLDDTQLASRAIAWAATRGGWSGRVAWQFITDLAGRQRRPLDAPPGKS